jgi:amidase
VAQRRLDAGEEAPLAGIPVAIKDNTDIAGFVTAHGTGAAGPGAGADSEVVRRLRSAGAILIGKTTLPELAEWGHMTESKTWGVTRNPWNPERSPGGSSGGSAAAVAAGLCSLAHGSDGGASIRVPAAFCGLFGLKPQRGRIPLAPDPDHWFGHTVFGPLARTVRDAALFCDVTAGAAPGQRYAAPDPPRSFSEAAARAPGRLRIAVSFKRSLPTPLKREQRRAVEDTAELLRELGHEVRERDPRLGRLSHLTVPRYMAGVAEDSARLAHPERLEGRTRTIIRTGWVLGGRALRRSLEREVAAASRINAIFDEHDVLLAPVTAAPAPRADVSAGHGALRTAYAQGPCVVHTAHWNYTGQPAAAVPAGLDERGMPTAVQLVGRPNDERTLLSLAAQLEEARPWAQRRPPPSA